MKLSEAILVGSTVMQPKPGCLADDQSSSGCALGMAAIGCGYTLGSGDAPNTRTSNADVVWPWLALTMKRPCSCWWFQVPRKLKAGEIIAHLFDAHVFGKKDWTMDQLAAWVEKAEPSPQMRCLGRDPVEVSTADTVSR